MLFVFNKVIEQRISVTRQGICLDFKRNYLPNDHVTAVSVSLKTFCNTRRKEACRIFCIRFDP